MNRKQFITLVILGLVVGGLGIYLYNRNKESYGTSYFDAEQRVLPEFPINEIGHVRIQTPTNEVNLVRGENNEWTVRERWGYPANYSEISGFLRNVRELKPVQDVQAGPSQYGRLNLLPPDKGGTNAATLIEFKDSKGANLKGLLLGKNYSRESAGGPFGGGGSFPVGRYVLVPGTENVWLVNETFSSVQPEPEQWLSKDFVKVEKIKSVSLTRPGTETNSWTLTRETEGGPWQLANPQPGENFDPSKASSLNYAFSSPSFDDVVSPDVSAEETGLQEPITAKIETFDGFTYNVRVGNETNSNYYVKVDVEGNFPTERSAPAEEKPEDKEAADKQFTENLQKLQEKLKNEQRHEKWTYLVSKWTVDSLLKNRGDFMAAPQQEGQEPDGEDHTGHDHPENGVAPSLNFLPPELQNIPPVPTSNVAPQAEPAADNADGSEPEQSDAEEEKAQAETTAPEKP